MIITPAEVRRIAALARLRLDEAEVQGMARELASILAHVDVLRRSELDEEPAPGRVAPKPTPLRDDRSAPDPLLHPPATFAPAWVDGFFVVPRLAALDPEQFRSSRSSPDE